MLDDAQVDWQVAELVAELEAASRAASPPPVQARTGEGAAAVTMEVSADDLRDDDMCVICLQETKTHLLVPCGHQCVCGPCSEQISAASRTCPVCRADVAMWCAVRVA